MYEKSTDASCVKNVVLNYAAEKKLIWTLILKIKGDIL